MCLYVCVGSSIPRRIAVLLGMLDTAGQGTEIIQNVGTTNKMSQHHIPEDLNHQRILSSLLTVLRICIMLLLLHILSMELHTFYVTYI